MTRRRSIRSSDSPKSVTLRDIAERCGVSTWTVSLALRGNPRINPTTAEHVQTTATEMGYNPALQEAARRLVSKRSSIQITNQVIALFLPRALSQAAYFFDIFHGLMNGLSDKGFGVLTNYIDTLPTHEGQYALPPSFYRAELDGLITYHAATPDSLVAQLRRNPGFAKRPIVSLMGNNSGCSSITTDDAAGAYAATKHLLDLGHRHLLQFIYSCGSQEARLLSRIASTKLALEEAGLNPTDHLHFLPLPQSEPIWMDPAYACKNMTQLTAMESEASQADTEFVQYMTDHPEITAVMGVNDANALRVWEALTRAGFKVPEEISIIGFDDTDGMYDEAGVNQLSSVKLPLIDVGQAAAELIVAQVTANEAPEEHVVLPVTYAQRHSTAPALVRVR